MLFLKCPTAVCMVPGKEDLSAPGGSWELEPTISQFSPVRALWLCTDLFISHAAMSSSTVLGDVQVARAGLCSNCLQAQQKPGGKEGYRAGQS